MQVLAWAFPCNHVHRLVEHVRRSLPTPTVRAEAPGRFLTVIAACAAG